LTRAATTGKDPPVRARTTAGLLVCLVLLSLGAGAASGSSPSPAAAAKALYTRLLNTPYAKSELPTGFSSVTISKTAQSKNSIKYHATGLVGVQYNGGPDAADIVIYYVFPTAADAHGDLTHPDRNRGDSHIVGKVPGISEPSLLLTGSITGKNSAGKTVTNGVTGAAAQSGTVIVAAASVSVAKTTSGNLTSAVALLRSALAHLAAVQR
jgi:hypothetical protein